jgi:hypothetical protein
MSYSEFLSLSPRIVSSLNRMNQNYEKKLLLDVVELVMPGEKEKEEEVVYADDLSIFF